MHSFRANVESAIMLFFSDCAIIETCCTTKDSTPYP